MHSKSQQKFERRQRRERRRKPTPVYFKLTQRGRRQRPRRREERKSGYYQDRYSRRIVAALLAIVFLSLTDAYLTLYLIDRGAAEVNPVMAFFLTLGPFYFIASKYLLTCASVVLLLIHKNVFIFRTRIRAKAVFYIIIAVFVSVIGWELVLVFRNFR